MKNKKLLEMIGMYLFYSLMINNIFAINNIQKTKPVKTPFLKQSIYRKKLIPNTKIVTALNLTEISVGMYHVCSLESTGQAYCWGYNYFGQLGNETNNNTNIPVAVHQPQGVIFNKISVGMGHSCALTNSGQAYCWGWNQYGQLGDGTNNDANIPVVVHQPQGVIFNQISARINYSCGLTSSGKAYCWGRNFYGQLGDETNNDANIPVVVHQPQGVIFNQVFAGGVSTCGLGSTGQAYCWGSNTEGQLGNGTNNNTNIPVAVIQKSGAFKQISIGGFHGCGLTSSGQAYCWGKNRGGELGDGTNNSINIPVAVHQAQGVIFNQVFAGGLDYAAEHSCGLGNTGQAYCWGRNQYGQLGDGTNNDANIPVVVHQPQGVIFNQVFAGGVSTCGLGSTGQAYCWGSNTEGQLGNGTNNNTNIPVAVIHPAIIY